MNPNLKADGVITNALLDALQHVVGSPKLELPADVEELLKDAPRPPRDYEDIKMTELLLVGSWSLIMTALIVTIGVVAILVDRLREAASPIGLILVFCVTGQLLHGARAIIAGIRYKRSTFPNIVDKDVDVPPWSTDKDLLVQFAGVIFVALVAHFM